MLWTTNATLPSASGDDAALDTGKLGRYTVFGRLGVGGMGVVLAAHDPALDRKVAIKLLWPSADGAIASETRLEREAQAMARLAHPNVVTVFEVDRVGARVFVAMELVEGATLRAWLAERKRGWREIVDVFVAAGRGLAAAHAAGLVHRDFKPDNVLIGADGRPRVSDFGLVSGLAEPASANSGEAAELDPAGTRVAGTPAYMSPEQWRGGVVDARSDQFAFCVAMLEALWGQRPFAGTETGELREAVATGQIAIPSPTSGVRGAPRRLIAALRRGLAIDPAERWPDMTTLLDEIAHAGHVRRRWQIAAAAVGVAVASSTIAIAVAGSRQAADPCAPPTAQLATVWSPERADAQRAHLAAIDPARGGVRADRIAAVFDAGARTWSAMHVEACRATRVDGSQSAALLDRRMECLGRWLTELGDTAAVVDRSSSPAAIDEGVRAAVSLSPLSVCADVHALAEELPPSPNVAVRAAANELVSRAQALVVEKRANRLTGLIDKTTALVADARALGYPPAIVAALDVHVRVQFAIGQDSAAEPTLRDMAQFAARARDDRQAAFAWTNLFMTVVADEGKVDQSTNLLDTANAAVLRAGDPPDLRAQLLFQQATSLDYRGQAVAGIALLGKARELLEAAGANDPTSRLAPMLADVTFETGTAHMFIGEDDRAIEILRDAIARYQAIYGPDGSDEAFGWQNLAGVLEQMGRYDEALAAYRNAARIREARIGESPNLVASLVGVASVFGDLGRWDEMLAADDHALAVQRTQVAPGDVELAPPLIGRGLALAHLGRLDDAAHSYDEAIALFDKGGITPDLPTALYDRAELRALRRHCDQAMPDYARARVGFEQQSGAASHMLIYPLGGEGACLVRGGRAADAIAPLERAVALHAEGADAPVVARAKLYLGRARVETGRDVTGGLAMVRASRAGLASRPDDVAELDRWLAARPK